MRIAISIIAVAVIAAALAVAGAEEDEAMADIQERLAKYARVEVSSDEPGLSEGQRAVLGKLIAAARLMDEIFWTQASSDGLAWLAELAGGRDELERLRLRFLTINKCRFDRQADNEPFLGTGQRPAGAAFWPDDLTREELESYLADHPDQRDELLGLTTVVRRDGDRLAAIPYSVVYEGWLRPAARLLLEAAELSGNESLSRYLSLRAEALLSDDYLESDMAWMDLEGNVLDIVIGPIEVYEDGLMNRKASYEAFVLVKDEEASRALESYIEAMDAMQAALPIDERFKRRRVRLGSSVGVFTLVYAAGDGDAGIKTIAISLPNDERVRERKGSRKIMLRNAIEAKFRMILVPIAERLLATEQLELLDGDLFFTNILLHEIAHSLGNDFVLDEDGERTALKVDEALMNHSSAIEECKADVGGLFSANVLVERGVITAGQRAALYANFLAGIFRSVRFGAADSHGIANAIELNWLLERGGVSLGDDGRWRVHEEPFAEALRDLLTELLTIQYSGDYERAGALVNRYGALPQRLVEQLDACSDIPVDIEFVWR